MASDYTDSFAGDPYFIKKGEQLSAAGMNAALNTKEKVANKTTTIDGSSTNAQYPSAKVVYDALSAKENTANKKDTLSNSSTEYPSSKAVTDALTGKANVSDLTTLQTTVNNLQEKLPIGTILMYDGASWQDNVTLKGWYSCNRTNYNNGLTPNLEDKFIKGKGSKANTGGSDTMILEEKHLPPHSHGVTLHQLGFHDGGVGGYTWPNARAGTGDASIKTTSVGEGEPFNILPSYYSLIYIKKMV